MNIASTKKLGGAAILLWAFVALFIIVLRVVPSVTYSTHTASISVLGTVVHAQDGDGGDGSGGASGDGSDMGNDNGGSNDANGTGMADGGGCGDCGGTPPEVPVQLPPPQTPTVPTGGNDHVTVVTECPAGTVGTYPNCTTPPTCPAGTTGTYPNCVTPPTCPAGTTGTYPNCHTPPTCPAGTTGTYPDCTTPPTCPAGTTGTYPDCNTPTCPTGTTGTYPDCHTICQNNCGGGGGGGGHSHHSGGGSIVYYYPPAQTPYITLSAVPYTGLDLGPYGTALYWGFLALWCLFAAYLLAVKRVQNNVVAWFSKTPVAHTQEVTHAHVHTAESAISHTQEHAHTNPAEGIDDFIASQLQLVSSR